jgi:hypothetical protein
LEILTGLWNQKSSIKSGTFRNEGAFFLIITNQMAGRFIPLGYFLLG